MAQMNLAKFSTQYLMRLWSEGDVNLHGEKHGLCMILMYEEGDKIEGLVERNLVSHFQDVLHEGDSSLIKNVSISDGPLCRFSFSNFEEIYQMDDMDDIVFDVGDALSFQWKGKNIQRLPILLEDNRGLKIGCVLYDCYVDMFLKDLRNYDSSIIVMILQFARTRVSEGEIVISNYSYRTRLILDAKLKEVTDYMKSDHKSYDINKYSILDQSMYKSPMTFLDKARYITISELNNLTEIIRCVLFATITGVLIDEPWFYLACRGCSRKIATSCEEENTKSFRQQVLRKYKCNICGPNIEAESRYRVKITVSDSTGWTNLYLYENEVVKLIFRHSIHMGYMLSEGNYPDELLSLVGNKMLFRISLCDNNIIQNLGPYSVSSISTNKNLINALKETFTVQKELSPDVEVPF